MENWYLMAAGLNGWIGLDDGWMRWMDGWIDEWMRWNGWMDGWMDGWNWVE